MNLINFKHRYDYGHDWYVQILTIKRWSLLQISVSWNDYASWPYLQIRSGSGDLVSIIFWVYKFGFDIDFCGRTWKWDYLEKCDEESDKDFLKADEC
jgi:hypothetical protein